MIVDLRARPGAAGNPADVLAVEPDDTIRDVWASAGLPGGTDVGAWSGDGPVRPPAAPDPAQGIPPRLTRGLLIVEGLYRSWWPWYRAVGQPEIPVVVGGTPTVVAGLSGVDVATPAVASLAGASQVNVVAGLSAVDTATLAPALTAGADLIFPRPLAAPAARWAQYQGAWPQYLGRRGFVDAPAAQALTAPLSGVDVATPAVASLAGASQVNVTAGLSGVNVATLTAPLAGSGTAPVVAGLAGVDVGTLTAAASGATLLAAGLASVDVATPAPTVTGANSAPVTAGLQGVNVGTLAATLSSVGSVLTAGLAAVDVATLAVAALVGSNTAAVTAGLSDVNIGTFGATIPSGLDTGGNADEIPSRPRRKPKAKPVAPPKPVPLRTREALAGLAEVEVGTFPPRVAFGLVGAVAGLAAVDIDTLAPALYADDLEDVLDILNMLEAVI